MDIDALKTDLDTAFKQLPPDVLGELSRLVLAHKEVFATKLPAALECLAPHIKAGMMEFAMGIFQIKEVEDAVMEVLGRNGVKPQAPLVGQLKALDDGRVLRWTGELWERQA